MAAAAAAAAAAAGRPAETPGSRVRLLLRKPLTFVVGGFLRLGGGPVPGQMGARAAFERCSPHNLAWQGDSSRARSGRCSGIGR